MRETLPAARNIRRTYIQFVVDIFKDSGIRKLKVCVRWK